MVTTDLEHAIQDRHATEVSSHTNGLLSATFILLNSALPFPNPPITFLSLFFFLFFLKKRINTCSSQQGQKNKTAQQEKKWPHGRGTIPKAPTLIFLSLLGVKMPASKSRDAQLLCPKLPENKPLNEQAGTAPYDTPSRQNRSSALPISEPSYRQPVVQDYGVSSLCWQSHLLCRGLGWHSQHWASPGNGLTTWQHQSRESEAMTLIRCYKLDPAWSFQNQTWVKGFMKSQLTNPRRSNPGLPSCSLSTV